jgi:hypothetical protein
MTKYRRDTMVLLAVFALTSLSGCTAEDAAATAAELAGDLARQLLTFWLL